MNELVAELIKDSIVAAGFEWTDKIAGLAKPITMQLRDESGNDVLKTFPVACVYNEGECGTDDYDSLVPDDSKRSIIYIEDNGTQYDRINSAVYEATAYLRLVCWMNIAEMGVTGCTKSAIAIQNLLATIPNKLTDTTPVFNIRLLFTGEAPKTSAVFNRYTYFEELTQYLMYPYDYFALELQVKYWFKVDCNVPLAIGTPICP